MKKGYVYLVLSFALISLTYIFWSNKKNYLQSENVIGVYVDNELQTSIPKKGEAVFSKAICDNDKVNYYWDIDSWGLYVENLNKKTKCNLYFINYSGETTFDFDYTGDEQTFTVLVSGTYKLETWGAQGGNAYDERASGGYGGYSVGTVKLAKDDLLILAVGKNGTTATSFKSAYSDSYNGGGSSKSNVDTVWGSGGGATSIQNALVGEGQLKNYENFKSNILIVSGGGGGAGWRYGEYLYNQTLESNIPNNGGSGGGISGTSGNTHSVSLSIGGNQISGGKSGNINSSSNPATSGFGYGASPSSDGDGGSGGGGGYYGGGSSYTYGAAGAGGSGYIGNTLLTNKTMYCYNCEESNEESTKTISTTCTEETPTTNCAKKGNGYARITLVSIDE